MPVAWAGPSIGIAGDDQFPDRLTTAAGIRIAIVLYARPTDRPTLPDADGRVGCWMGRPASCVCSRPASFKTGRKSRGYIQLGEKLRINPERASKDVNLADWLRGEM